MAGVLKVVIVGAGPAGLHLAALLKRDRPQIKIRIVEQNPRDATFGFGVVFSDRALDFLAADDPATHAALKPQLETWSDITLVHRGERIRIDGVGFTALGRLALLQVLLARVQALGIEPEFDTALRDLSELGDADLIVGADGVNSLVRRGGEFGESLTQLSNRFVWYGTTKRFDSLTQTFVTDRRGSFNAHHYRYSGGMSTFIVETDAATYARAGFAQMSEDQTRAACEEIFAETLDGHPLISNKSVWRQFPQLRTARWSVGNRVIIGDAAHTAHFSIGSGTRLAMEDAIALARALNEHSDVLEALAAYEAARRPILEKIVTAADASAAWYEKFPEHMQLAPDDFAMSYISRSGRIDLDRLAKSSPRFVERMRGRDASGSAV